MGGWYQGEAVSVMQGGAVMQHPSSFFLFVVSAYLCQPW